MRAFLPLAASIVTLSFRKTWWMHVRIVDDEERLVLTAFKLEHTVLFLDVWTSSQCVYRIFFLGFHDFQQSPCCLRKPA